MHQNQFIPYEHFHSMMYILVVGGDRNQSNTLTLYHDLFLSEMYDVYFGH